MASRQSSGVESVSSENLQDNSNSDEPLKVTAEGCPPEVKIDVDTKKTTRLIIRVQANAFQDNSRNNAGRNQEIHIHNNTNVSNIKPTLKGPSKDEKNDYKVKFDRFINKDDMTFLEVLEKCIQNHSQHKHAEHLLRLLTDKLDDENTDVHVKERIKNSIDNYPIGEDVKRRLLHEAALHENPTGDQQLIELLLKLCPGQVTQKRTDINEGQNVLHILVFNRNLSGAKLILKTHQESTDLLSSQAECGHPKTRMMGETPVFIAALSFDKEMVDYLISKGGVGMLRETTSQGDTVFHALVRYAAWYPDKQQDAKDMMEQLNNILQNDEKLTKDVAIKELQSLWRTQDKEGLTVLQLAAFPGQYEIYKWVLELKDIYLKYYKTENLFEYIQYDITEIDSVALDSFRFPNNIWMTCRTNPVRPESKHKSEERQRPQSAPQLTHNSTTSSPISRKPERPQSAPQLTHKSTTSSPISRKPERPQSAPQLTHKSTHIEDTTSSPIFRSPSVIEIACETKKTQDAFLLIDIPLFDDIIDTKWKTYRTWFFGWLCLHLICIALITSQALFKAKLIGNTQQPTPVSDPYVLSLSIVLFMIGSILLCLELVRLIHRHPLCLLTVHHNGVYRVLLVIFSLTLMADSVWYWITTPDNSYCLLVSLVVGGWFLPFFLRPFKIFSFFTTMLRHAFLADGARFLTMMLLEFLTFSIVMYFLFLPTPGGPPAEFQNLGVTALTMFKMMLGLSDLDILTSAPYPWLSVTLFIIFILLTSIFMLNSLIAMMTNTYSQEHTNRELYCKLQTLSVVMMIESMLLFRRHACNSGEKEEKGGRFLSKCFFFGDKTKVVFDKLGEDMLEEYKKKQNKKSIRNDSTNFYQTNATDNQASKITGHSKWRRHHTSRKTAPAEIPVDKKKQIKRPQIE